MTLLEYVQSLQDQGATDIPDKVQEWKKKNQPKVEEEVIKTPAEEVKINDAADQTGATVTSTPNASENSSSGSGELVSQDDYGLNISPVQGLSNKTGGFGTSEFYDEVFNNIALNEYEEKKE
jgi:hypothetical protein